jgi:FSR family fosmidomycin resistance protein-like MFS transporter
MDRTTPFSLRAGPSEAQIVTGVCIAHFVSHYYILLLPPLFEFVRAEYHVSYTELGFALALFNIVSTILQPPAGFLADRYSPRIVLVVGLLISAFAIVVTAAVHSFWVLVAMFGLLGVGNTVYHPAGYSILSQQVPSARISQVYSLHTFAGILGSSVAPATLLYLTYLVGWRGALYASALLGVFAAAFLLLQRDAPRPQWAQRHLAGVDAKNSAGWRLLLSAPILCNLVFFVLLAIVSAGIYNYTVVALRALYGTTLEVANTALTAHIFLSAIGVLAGGVLAARLPHQHAMVTIVGLVGTGLSLALVAFVDFGALMLVLVMSIGGFLSGVMSPPRDMIVRDVTPPGAFGKVFGFVTTGFNIGGVVAPLIFGLLMDRGQPRAVFWGIVIFIALGIFTVAAMPKRPAHA